MKKAKEYIVKTTKDEIKEMTAIDVARTEAPETITMTLPNSKSNVVLKRGEMPLAEMNVGNFLTTGNEALDTELNNLRKCQASIMISKIESGRILERICKKPEKGRTAL